jgi:hypothetical protein
MVIDGTAIRASPPPYNHLSMCPIKP